MEIVTTYSNKKAIYENPVEFVERKGKGHPDTICDRIAEEASLAVSSFYLKKFNRVLHHNIDKAVLAGGQANVKFGGGEIITPIYILLVGRATKKVNEEELPIEEIIEENVKNWFKNNMRFLDPFSHIEFNYKIRGGSVDLIKNFEMNQTVPLSNDTSFGVGFAPLTYSEKITLEIEERLNSKEIKEEYPAIGEDIKVMTVRKNNELKITIACAIISKFINNEMEYDQCKRFIKKEAEYVINSINNKLKYEVNVNSADNYKHKIYYLTITGTSAEHGDDGQVGRGNRANGLITPYRAMTLEATAGKNPLSHTGKLYSIVSQKICDKIFNEYYYDIKEVYCYMVSKIGNPITEPKMVNVVIIPNKKGPDEQEIESIVKEELNNISNLWKEIIKRKIKLF